MISGHRHGNSGAKAFKRVFNFVMEFRWPDFFFVRLQVATFFVSYMLIVGTVLMNIVVAVLLDEFRSAVAVEKV